MHATASKKADSMSPSSSFLRHCSGACAQEKKTGVEGRFLLSQPAEGEPSALIVPARKVHIDYRRTGKTKKTKHFFIVVELKKCRISTVCHLEKREKWFFAAFVSGCDEIIFQACGLRAYCARN